MAKHTRPYDCPEIGCDVSPFGDKAGLQRHKREVHRLRDGDEKPAKVYPCPKAGCKRNRKAFSRKSNMLEHYRRTHGEDSQTSVESIGLVTANPNPSFEVPGSKSSATTSAAPSSPGLDHDEGQKSALREGLRAQAERLERERAELDKKLAAVRAVMRDL